MKRFWSITLFLLCLRRWSYAQSDQHIVVESKPEEDIVLISHSTDMMENTQSAAGKMEEKGDTRTPNWDVYEVLNTDINVSQSVEFVKNIPVFTYWDVHRGGFRTGILGDKILDTYPQFVTYTLIKNSTADPKGPISLINVTTIDTNSLFMHLLVVTQYMDQKSMNVSQTIKILEDQFSTFDSKLETWKNLTGDDWKTAAQLRAECDQKEIQIEMLGKRIEIAKLRVETRLATLREYYQVRIAKSRFTPLEQNEIDGRISRIQSSGKGSHV